jgi:hypothetical protein
MKRKRHPSHLGDWCLANETPDRISDPQDLRMVADLHQAMRMSVPASPWVISQSHQGTGKEGRKHQSVGPENPCLETPS